MKKNLTALTVACATFFYATDCSAGKVVREDRKTEPFSKLSAGSSVDVYYAHADSYSIVVEADEDIIGEIVTKTEGETLVVERKKDFKPFSGHFLTGKWKLKVYVSSPTLYAVSISGGADFHADNMKSDGSFQLTTSGGADAKIVNLAVAGSADISASGGSDAKIANLTVAENANISASGGADCDVRKLQARECSLRTSAGSDLNIHLELSGNLQATASGGADMNISGKANDVVATASGGADIDMRKLLCKSADIHTSGGSDVLR
jgi:hypothetical protein